MQALRRILVKGVAASDVQGIVLREAIQKVAKSMGVKGSVRNVKGRPLVEIICEAGKAAPFAAGISRLQESLGTKFDVQGPTEELFDEFKDFEVIKEDDLTEMVWGLQGAGRAFLLGEERRKSRLHMSLTNEILSISIRVARAKESKYSEFPLFCTEHFLKEPPHDTGEAFMFKLRDLHNLCSETNEMMRDIKDGKAVLGSQTEDNLKKISEITEGLIKSLREVQHESSL